MKGSRRKEAEPRPPCPALRTTRAESTNARRLVRLLVEDADAPAVLAHPLVSNFAWNEREQRVVAAHTDPGARGNPAPTLAHEDRAGVHGLTGVDLHAQHLRLGVAPVSGRATTFLVCHLFLVLFWFSGGALGLLFLDYGRCLGLDFHLRLRHRLFHLGLPLRLCLLLGGLGLYLLFDNGARRHLQPADREDLQRGVVRAAAAMDAHTLLGLVPQRLDPRAAAVRQHLRVDVHAVDRGAPDFDVGAVGEEQDAIQLHRRAGLGGEAIDQDSVSWRYAVLLSTADDDSRQRSIRLGHDP